VLGGEKARQGVKFILRQFEKFHQYASASLGVSGRPGRLSRLRYRDRVLDLGASGESNLGLNLTGIRVENLPKPPGRPFHLFAADKVADLPHKLSPVD
jgi:hypothetical protein